MKVAILTMFNGLERTYSLVNVVAEHLRMLLDNNIPVKMLVCENCPDEQRSGIFLDERIEWVKVRNTLNGKQIHWHDYSQPEGKVHDTFFEEAEAIAEDLIDKLSDVDICMMHDIHYQGWHLVHNVAVRKAQEKLPNVRFIAVTHSAPNNKAINSKWPFSARYTPMPNTIYVYPTASGIPALAKQYNVPEGKCRVINNSLDLTANFGEDVRSICKKIDLFSPDILMVYPGRLTQGKKFEKVAAFAGAIKKKTERTVKIIFCDFASMDIDPNIYKAIIRRIGCKFGLDDGDMYFTSDLGYPNGFPREGVLELFILSNLFVCPSFSESFGLTVLEAASRGNFIILNEAVPALEELGKQIGAYFMRWDARNFGYDTKENYNPSEKVYLENNADMVVNMMRENQVILSKTLVRQRYSPQWICENQLLPLLDK
ncbi:glycosyltransferase [Clostridium sp. YIM B02515]|uniref:Glycosyltransferase n=1 Tax=Clostridium rhizosphaerae TaxID=2803861 RepID=A0ABS1T7C6_9CLOT|nr:glycosyltransferase [Clostridium rhizosphaerae]MBL4934672.1 glycosyltransferase [Clostridium rhizosphaerae]